MSTIDRALTLALRIAVAALTLAVIATVTTTSALRRVTHPRNEGNPMHDLPSTPGLDYDVVETGNALYVRVHGLDPALDESDLLALLYALQEWPT